VGTKPEKTWYGVRTLYRVTAEGKPKSRDKFFDSEATLVEDRVVLFQAAGFDDAIAQATKEARAYCRQVKFNNAYGQRVRMRFLDTYDAYEIGEMSAGPPAAGWEVYSSTELVGQTVSDSAVIRTRMGAKASPVVEVRYKFMDGRILRKALAAVASDANPGKR
jgi:hypothetical protein